MSQGGFSDGDVVQLRSGGPLMTVVGGRADGSLICSWFHEGKLQTEHFNGLALKKTAAA